MKSNQGPEQAATGGGSGKVVNPPEKPEAKRLDFPALVLANPNHFGNLEKSPFKPVTPMQTNTSYEELVCLGLNPDFDRLEAVIDIKRQTGYQGDICSLGSFEYVRFYADLQNNGVWVDLGTANVQVYDIPGAKPLCYAVSIDFAPFRKLCFAENLIPVRAILSWHVPPPPNAPGFVPVWGNQLTVEVQIRPLRLIIFHEFLRELASPVSPLAAESLKLIDPAATLAVKPPEKLTVAQKAEIYKGKDVPAHRFAFPEAHALLASHAASPNLFAGGGQSPLHQLGLEVAALPDLLKKIHLVTDGDTTFEELKCVGLRPESDTLEGVLTIKRSSGYSGQLCSAGSNEYVAFWIDFGDGAGFTFVGTSSVQVHDLTTIPAQGLQYAVFLKSDFSGRTVPCTAGPRVVRLRAILSWEAAPPPNDPNHVPVWGNRLECEIQLRPAEPAGHKPLIETVGNMGVNHIDLGSGLATGSGVGAAFAAYQSPFGGTVKISGRIGNPPVFSPATKLRYRIEVSRYGADLWQPLTNTITVSYSRWAGGVPLLCNLFDYVCDRDLVPTNDGDGLGDGWYDYIQDFKSPTQTWLVEDQLGSWVTDAGMEGLWQLRMAVKDMSVPAGLRTRIDGDQTVTVDVDNTAPAVALAITGATFEGSPIPATDCGKFPVGTILSGTYDVHDPGTSSPEQHFGALSFEVLPAGPAHGAAVSTALPPPRSFPAVPTTGESSTWTLDTGHPKMDACGYVIHLIGSDRTIYNSGFVGLSNSADVGFCLIEAPK